MRTTVAGVAEQRPQRSRLDDPARSIGRGELAAGLATAAVLVQLLFAQLTLLLAVALVAVGRGSRWRPHWLLLPALTGLCWLLAAGTDGAVSAFAAAARRSAVLLIGSAVHPARLLHLASDLNGGGAWLPRELPLALLAATGEAALVLWLGWWRRSRPRPDDWLRGWQWRPGLGAALRRRTAASALAAGQTVTADGCALGLDVSTGRLAGFSWAEATHGVLLAGSDRKELEQLGLAATCAALRRRKTVLVLDVAANGAALRVAGLARSLGVPAAEVRAAGVSAADVHAADGNSAGSGRQDITRGAIGRAIRSRGVVLISARHAEAAREAIDDLTGVLASLRDLRLRADCLAWISGCEVIDPGRLSELLALGPPIGAAVILSSANAAHAAALGSVAGVVVASGHISDNLALSLAVRLADDQGIGASRGTDAAPWSSRPPSRPISADAVAGADATGRAINDLLRTQRAGAFAVIVRERGLTWPSCLAVAITTGNVS